MIIDGGRNCAVLCAVAASMLALTDCANISKPPLARPQIRATMAIPIGQADVNLDSLRTQIQALPFSGTGWTRTRKRQGAMAGVSVKIRPIGDSRSIDSASGPMSPTIVAWIQNQDLLYSAEHPAFKSKSQAQYLVQIYRDPTTSVAKYQIIEIPESSHGTVTVIMSDVLIQCHHDPKPAPDADFRSCTGAHEPSFAAAPNRTLLAYAHRSAGQRPGAALSYFPPVFLNGGLVIQDPTWIACNSGCCTLAGTETSS